MHSSSFTFFPPLLLSAVARLWDTYIILLIFLSAFFLLLLKMKQQISTVSGFLYAGFSILLLCGSALKFLAASSF